MRWRAIIILAGLWGAAVGGRAAVKEPFPGVDDGWFRYQSPHFELFSRNPGETSRQLLHNLELLHTVFLDTLHLKERQPQEVTVYFFGNARDFHAYLQPGMNQSIAGYYLASPDRAVIVLPAEWDFQEAQRLIFHEYVHHLTFITGDDPALWYREGIAELFSTMEETSKGLVLGRPIPGHVEILRDSGVSSLEALFSTQHDSPNYNEATMAGIFYAESWALLHYLYFGRTDLSAQKLERFIDYSRQDVGNHNPEQRRQLFQACTGLNYDGMAKRLDKYMRNGRYGTALFPMPKMAGRDAYTVRRANRDEVREQLTELTYRVTRNPVAKLALLNGVEQDPGMARRYEVLGAVALEDGDENEARERWLKAIEAGTTNPAIYHELAMLENRRWFSAFDIIYFRLPDETAQYLRNLLQHSIERAPDQIQAYEMLAWVEAATDKPVIKNINLVQEHYPTLQRRASTALALAVVRVRMNDEAGARDILDQLEKTEPEAEILRGIAAVRQYLDERHPANP